VSESPALETVRRDLRAPRAAGVAGLLFAALFVASLVLLRNHPASGSTADEIADWYLRRDVRNLALVGLYLAPFSGIAFLWFIAVIRNWLGDREDRFFSTVFLGSGLLFVAMLFVAAGAAGALLAGVRFRGQPVPSPDSIVLSRSLAYAFLFIYAMRAAAVFMLVVSTIGLRTGSFPRSLVLIGYAVALALLFVPTQIDWVVLFFPTWVAVVSALILRADPPDPFRSPADQISARRRP
jgi:hypothetical protein